MNTDTKTANPSLSTKSYVRKSGRGDFSNVLTESLFNNYSAIVYR